MHGIKTIHRLNAEACEAQRIMAAHDLNHEPQAQQSLDLKDRQAQQSLDLKDRQAQAVEVMARILDGAKG